MSDQGTCEWCGGPIPPRSNPRGQRARFCSDAHRAAAHRARTKAQHDAELEAARTQTAIDLRNREDATREAIQEVQNATRIVQDQGRVPEKLAPLAAAALELASAVHAADELRDPEGASRGTRRRVRRRATRPAGDTRKRPPEGR